MKQDASFGIIPLKRYRGEWRVLLIYQNNGFWGFPKGHAEAEETPHQSAERELKEETSLSVVNWLPYPPFTEHYFFKNNGETISKKVIYFLAEVKGRIALQQIEIADSKWLSLPDAIQRLTYKESRVFMEKTIALLRGQQ